MSVMKKHSYSVCQSSCSWQQVVVTHLFRLHCTFLFSDWSPAGYILSTQCKMYMFAVFFFFCCCFFSYILPQHLPDFTKLKWIQLDIPCQRETFFWLLRWHCKSFTPNFSLIIEKLLPLNSRDSFRSSASETYLTVHLKCVKKDS